MTNMEQIEQIVKEGGVHYGRTVEKNSDKYRGENIKKIQAQRKCEECGRFFTPTLRRDGSLSSKKKCPKCIEERRQAKELERERKRQKARKVYQRPCSKCGEIVETTQAPRGRVPIYCPDCRKKIKKGEHMVTYREAVV